MINLAGDKGCDVIIIGELDLAGIPFVELNERRNSEVPAKYIGNLNGFTFIRAWYYWVVGGYMPLLYAKELYEKYKDLNIRVAGHCGNPPPEEWCEPRDYDKKCKIYFDKWRNKELTLDEVNNKCNEIRQQGDQFITNYHIDSQEGLLRFAEIIKQYNINA